MVVNFHVFHGSFNNRETFTVNFFNKGYKMTFYNFKACERDICDMHFPSPSGLLKNSLIVQSSRRPNKLITSAGGKRSYISSEKYHCKVCS